MAASVVETILARVLAVLLAGSTAAGTRVYRARDDAFGSDETPAINIRRDSSPATADGIDTDDITVGFTVAFHTDGAAWETDADALHMAAHALLAADATLATKGQGLRCTGTDVQDDSADQIVGRITASYEMHVFVSPADLTTIT